MLDYQSLIPKSFSEEDRYNLLEIIKINSNAYQEEIKTDDKYLSLNNKIISDIIYWYVNLFDCKQIVKTFPVYTPVVISPYTKETVAIKTRKSEHFVDIDKNILEFIKENLQDTDIHVKEEEMIFDYIRKLQISNIKFNLYFPKMEFDGNSFKPKLGMFDADYFQDMSALLLNPIHSATLPLNSDEILIQYIKPEPSVIFYPYKYMVFSEKEYNTTKFKYLYRYHLEKTKWFDRSFDLIRLKNNMSEKLFINKFQVDFMIKDLIKQIGFNNEQFTHVIGIANGGLNVSIPIAKILNLPHKSVTIRFYANENKSSEIPKEINFDQLKDLDENSNILFCDDLIDSGISLNYLKQNIKFKHKIAVLYYNKNSFNIIPEYYCYEKPKQWIVFPWELTSVICNSINNPEVTC